ncbi:MAG: haloacid dehalogenase [Candidatus Chloroheliales bacterium]|nr:MAG: haloacid dehalogenase [Chloroflexota bacterium]
MQGNRVQQIGEAITATFEEKNAARERALSDSRAGIRHCANAIRAVHRGDFAAAEQLLNQAGAVINATREQLISRYPDLYWAGYVQDAQKEYAEARLTYAAIHGDELPDHIAVGVEAAPYLNGLGEMSGELRRYILDIVRHGGNLARCEELLALMEDVYSLLVTVDYPDAITNGLRRNTDLARGVLERTRGDLTLITRQQELEAALRKQNHE